MRRKIQCCLGKLFHTEAVREPYPSACLPPLLVFNALSACFLCRDTTRRIRYCELTVARTLFYIIPTPILPGRCILLLHPPYTTARGWFSQVRSRAFPGTIANILRIVFGTPSATTTPANLDARVYKPPSDTDSTIDTTKAASFHVSPFLIDAQATTWSRRNGSGSPRITDARITEGTTAPQATALLLLARSHTIPPRLPCLAGAATEAGGREPETRLCANAGTRSRRTGRSRSLLRLLRARRHRRQ